MRRLLRFGLNVGDLDRAQEFYVRALGFAPVGEAGDPALARLLGVRRARTRTLRYGEQRVELTLCDPPGAAYPDGSTTSDTWFQHFALATPDIAAAVERLRRHRYTAITQDGPQRLPAASGGAIAYKFRDPDGHPLELIQFAAAATGIDHSAISVADAARSRAFYEQLGLSRASDQVNTGPEQDRLDGLRGVEVDVVAMRPSDQATPHLELLGYRAPRGRAMQVGVSDIAATRLVLESDTTDADAAVVFDPDRHALLVVPGGEAGR